jgi:hypothetical protein
MSAFEANLTELSVSIGFPCGAYVPWQTALSLAKTMQVAAMEGAPCEISVVAGCSVVTTARSNIVEAFLAGTASRLFWIDSDIVWEPRDFFRLLALSSKMDVVCAAYPMKTAQRQFTIKHPDLVNFELNDFGCVKIEGAGLGFTVMTREVVERVAAGKPVLKQAHKGADMTAVFRLDSVDGYDRGEDQAFFADIRELGFPVWLDPTIQLGHVGSHVYRGDPIAALNLTHVYRPGA